MSAVVTIMAIPREVIEAVAPIAPMPAISRDLAGTLGVMERGVTPHPIRPGVLAEVRALVDRVGVLLAPAQPAEMLAWLCKLRHSVRNAPTGLRDIQLDAEIFWEDCAALPCGVWADATRSRWRTQAPRDGYYPGSFWPTPAELHAVLATYGGELRSVAYWGQKLIEAAEPPVVEEPPPRTPEAQEYVRRLCAAWRMEQAQGSSLVTERRAPPRDDREWLDARRQDEAADEAEDAAARDRARTQIERLRTSDAIRVQA